MIRSAHLRSLLQSNRWSMRVPLSRLNSRRITRSDLAGRHESGEGRVPLAARQRTEDPLPKFIADALLEHAMKLDQGRPSDDITVVVLRVTSHSGDSVRRMSMRLPLEM